MEEKKDENIKQNTNKSFSIEKMKTIIIGTLFILLALTNLGDTEQSKNVTTSNNDNTSINQELVELKSKYLFCSSVSNILFNPAISFIA